MTHSVKETIGLLGFKVLQRSTYDLAGPLDVCVVHIRRRSPHRYSSIVKAIHDANRSSDPTGK